HLRRHRRQPILALLKFKELVFVWHPYQLTRRVVRPPVKATHKPQPMASASPCKLVASMRTHVVESTYCSVLAPHYDNRTVAHLNLFNKIVSCLRNLFLTPNIEPNAMKNTFPLALEILKRDTWFDRHWARAEFRILCGPPSLTHCGRQMPALSFDLPYDLAELNKRRFANQH